MYLGIEVNLSHFPSFLFGFEEVVFGEGCYQTPTPLTLLSLSAEPLPLTAC